MRLVIDGRVVDLDETVERVVIEKGAFGAITITSHLGVKKQVIHAAPVDHTAFRDAIGANGKGHSYQPAADVKAKPSNGRRLGGFAAPGFVHTEKQKAAWKGKTCVACKKGGQGTKAKTCSQCGIEFPPTTRVRN